MSRVNQRAVTFGTLASRSPPITKLPAEVLMEIFKAYVKSYPEVLDQRVVDLCLVGKYWNAVANGTPELWTKINLSFPFADHHLAAMVKRIHASKLQEIDVSINFRDPHWDGGEYGDWFEIPKERVWTREVTAVLKGTEKRWKSIKVTSDIWLPFYELMDEWTFAHLPSLESISMERVNTIFTLRDVPFDPRQLVGPMTLFGPNASLPRLREASLFAVHVDWNDANACFRNLRRLEIMNQAYDVGPSFEQFAAMLCSSPQLEYLNVTGFCPEPPLPVDGFTVIYVVPLPMLKEFIFGWKDVELGCTFLQMFQIGPSLESLTLLDTESGLSRWEDPQTGCWGWVQESQRIFETLSERGSAVPGDEEDLPPRPFISMRGVKRLRIAWTKAAPSSLAPFLTMLTGLEEIWLEDVDKNVLDDTAARIGDTWRRLKKLDLRWTWHEGIPNYAQASVLQLESVAPMLTAQGVEHWRVGQRWP